jgi:hypothetical protein
MAVILVKNQIRRWSWLADAVFLIVIAGALVRPIYRAEYLDAWNSIEATFISDARFLSDHWPRPGWQPNWYGGTRFDYVYPPALRYGTAAISRAKGYSTARAYHVYIYALYLIGIAGVYWFVRAGSRSRWVALWAAVATAIVSPCFLLFPTFLSDYRNLHWMPLRLGVLIRYGEGPHMSALALLPFALAAAWRGLRRGYPGRLAAAAVFSALVVANNFYGATALALFFPLVAWAAWLAERDAWVWARAAGVAAIAWGLCAFWLTPSYFRITLANMALVSAPGHAWSAALGAAVVALYAVLTFRWAYGRPERDWFVFVIGALAVVGLNVAGNQYFDFRVIGEPGRLIPELDLVLLIAAGAALAWIARYGAWGRACAVALAIACLAPGYAYVTHAWRVLPPRSSHTDRVEYQLTGWIGDHLPGVRVLATGSLRFWYNAWRELPQLGGGSEQGTLNRSGNFAHWHALTSVDIPFVVAWLQAMGTGAVAVHDKTSREVYHDFEKPEKFEGRLDKLYDNGAGDRIYRVPRRYPALARVVDAAAIRAIRVTTPEPDVPTVKRYASLLEQGPDAPVTLVRGGPESMTLSARLAPGQALLAQESYDPAWTAQADGRAVPVERDPFGQMLIEPGPGEQRVTLRFVAPLEDRVGAALGVLALAVVLWLAAPARVWRALRGRRTS